MSTTAKNPFDLTGKVVLVTGGNSGIGLGAAHAFAAAGADVVIWGRRQDRNAQALRELEVYGTRVVASPVDVASPEAVSDGIAETVSALGRIDTAFVNAGVRHTAASLIDLKFEDYRYLLDVNQDGAVWTMREAARHMVDRFHAGDPGGSIIVNGSLTVFQGVVGIPHYAAAKGALASVMRVAATEQGQYAIRVNMICPGFIRREFKESPGVYPLEQMVSDRNPIPRIGEPADLTGILVYLASDASSYHTGDTITIDGGWMAKSF